MSIRTEQYRSLLYARDLLQELLDPRKTPRVPKAIRDRARHCLRHYPFLHNTGEPMFSRDGAGMNTLRNGERDTATKRGGNDSAGGLGPAREILDIPSNVTKGLALA